MADKDLLMRHFVRDNNFFADVVNLHFFKGERVVSPDELEDVSPDSLYQDSKGQLRELRRDNAKRWTRGNTYFALFGIESQSEKDPDMPIRVLAYSGGDYREQLNNRKKRAKSKSKRKRLYPVFTVVLYYGKYKWTSDLTLKEILTFPDEPYKTQLMEYFNDYRIWVCDISRLTLQQILSLQSELKAIAAYFYRVRHKARPKELDAIPCRRRAEVIRFLEQFNEITLSESIKNLVVDEKEGIIKMNDLAEEFITKQRKIGERRGIRKGLEKGLEKGREEGLEKGREEGLEKGREEQRRDYVLRMHTRGFSNEQIADILEIDLELVEEWLKQ